MSAPLPPPFEGTPSEGMPSKGDPFEEHPQEGHSQEIPSQEGRSQESHPLEGHRPLHPLPKGLVELYGLLAVLVVLVPEWMASGALSGFWQSRVSAALPTPTRAWRELPELRLAAMSLAELRLQARQLRLGGYAGLGRDRLSARLLRRSKQRKALW